VARKKKGGRNRRKAVVALKRQHQRVGNRRKDFLNKRALDLIRRYGVIVLEDLRIRNMVRNRHLSKSILDAGWGYLIQSAQRAPAWTKRQTLVGWCIW
jgi:putative transposase